MSVEAHTEKREFQAEVKQLLDLMIHSLYSNKEIFLRELVSNASDACDKLRFEALADDALYEGDTDLAIHVDFDKDARTVTIRDNGVGMDRQEVIDNIGTIAKSGTRRFFESLTGDQAKDAQLIGQFGVGFYSAFIVADKVTVTSRRAGMGPEHGVRWESDGAGEYTLETVEKPERGTEVTLHLREGEDEFLDNFRLRSIITRYSDHITFPVLMKKPAGDEEEGEPEWERVNDASALWTRPKTEISDEEYQSFYKHLSHDFSDPLAWTHNKVEGKHEYTSLLFVPAKAPFDLWDRDQTRGLKLYVKRVFIMDAAEQLLPRYLRFVRGVIDSADLPLNVSREILQGSRVVNSIRAASVKKVLGLLESLAKNEPEKYADFWKEFGAVLKEGPVEDAGNQERIAKLLRFASTHDDSAEQTVALEDYVSRMQDGQDKIYYITAETHAAAKNSPHLEVFRKKGIEVLLLSDRVDEWLVSHLTEFDGKPLQSVAKGSLDLEDEDKQENSEDKEQEERSEVLDRIQKALGDRVEEVRSSSRLVDSPACLVMAQQDLPMHMQRILKEAGHEMPGGKPALELNLDHPLVQRMESLDDEALAEWAELVFDQAVLAEGGQLEDPASFVKRMNHLLAEAV